MIWYSCENGSKSSYFDYDKYDPYYLSYPDAQPRKPLKPVKPEEKPQKEIEDKIVLAELLVESHDPEYEEELREEAEADGEDFTPSRRTIKGFLTKLPSNFNLSNLSNIELEIGMHPRTITWESSATVFYRKIIPNPEYKEDMKEYNKDLKKYASEMKKYEKAVKKYNNACVEHNSKRINTLQKEIDSIRSR